MTTAKYYRLAWLSGCRRVNISVLDMLLTQQWFADLIAKECRRRFVRAVAIGAILGALLGMMGCQIGEAECATLASQRAEQDGKCDAEKANGVSGGAKCAEFSRLALVYELKCTDYPRRSFDAKEMPPVRGADK